MPSPASNEVTFQWKIFWAMKRPEMMTTTTCSVLRISGSNWPPSTRWFSPAQRCRMTSTTATSRKSPHAAATAATMYARRIENSRIGPIGSYPPADWRHRSGPGSAG